MKKVYFRLVSIALVSFLLAAFALPQEAGALLQERTMASILREARYVVVGTVISMENIETEKWGICTDVSIRADEVLKGRREGTFTVRYLGGTDGERILYVEDMPTFKLGEKVLVLLRGSREYPGVLLCAGWARGKYGIRNGKVVASNTEYGISLELVKKMIQKAIRDPKGFAKLETEIVAKIDSPENQYLSVSKIIDIAEKDIGTFLERDEMKGRQRRGRQRRGMPLKGIQ